MDIAQKCCRFFKVGIAILLCISASACTSQQQEKDVDAFRAATIEDIHRISPDLLRALVRDDPLPAIEPVLRSALLDLRKKGRPISALAILDKQGAYVTGYHFDEKENGELKKVELEGISFAGFKSFGEAIQSRKIVQAPLYFKKRKIFAIGVPLIKEGNLLGFFGLSFDADAFEKKWGLDEAQFLSVDLNGR